MSKYFIQVTWDDTGHLSEEAKRDLWKQIPEYQREARAKGIPQLSGGMVYPMSEHDIQVDDFVPPPHWPRVYGLDVGWNWTAAIWLAYNREADTVYAYQCYKRGQAEPAVHAEAIKARGSWIPGVIDPAAAGSSQVDGRKLLPIYRGLIYGNQSSVLLSPANHAVEAGIYAVWTRFSSGRLKICKSLVELWSEYRAYRRNDKGVIQKGHDHIMDALRYGVFSGLEHATVGPLVPSAQPNDAELVYEVSRHREAHDLSWMA